jgi:DNA-binding transcriptional MocR family regulator
MTTTIDPLYLRVAQGFERQIRDRALMTGDRLPSVRKLSRSLGISAGTVAAAYEWLERQGAVVAQAKSGFYVAQPRNGSVEPKAVARPRPPTRVTLSDLVLEIQGNTRNPVLFPLGEAVIGQELLPDIRINRAVRRVASSRPSYATASNAPAGSPGLRRQIARQAYRLSFSVSPDDVIVTNGIMEAMNLAIQSVARPGEVVAIESPGCYEALRSLECFGIKALEIPMRARAGADLGRLARMVKAHRVKAILTAPCCQNPLGHGLPDATKAEIVALGAKLGIPIIEDDTFGDLAFAPRRPRPLKSFDSRGNVIYCGPISQFVAPEFHLAWMHAGRFKEAIESRKSITASATPVLTQQAFAEFMESGAYERHLRKLVRALAESTRAMVSAVTKYFPAGTRLTLPDGGFYTWIELPDGRRGLALYRAALKEGLSIIPGVVFSPHRQFDDCIRLSCGFAWSAEADRQIARLGLIAKRLDRAADLDEDYGQKHAP